MYYQHEEFDLWSTRLLELEPCIEGLVDEETINRYWHSLNQIIDHLNSFNYEQRFINNKVGEELLIHCTRLIPLSNGHLVTKFSPLIVHLIRKQNINLTKETAVILFRYLLNALVVCSQWLHSDILLALSTFLFSNASKVEQFREDLIGDKGVLINFADPQNSHLAFEIRYYSVRCIEYLTIKESNHPYLPQEMSQNCFNIFLSNLRVIATDQAEDVLHCKLRSSCFIGIQNIILESKASTIQSIGELLATLKIHVFYGLSNQSQLLLTTCLYPSPLSQSYFNQETPKPKDSSSSKSSSHNSRSKKRRSSSKKMTVSDQRAASANNLKYTEGKSDDDKSPCQRGVKPFVMTKLVSSSESEFSDSEGGNVARLRSAQTRVRHCALAALYSAAKVIDRKIMFGYWSSFLPDAPSSVGTLTSCFLKDPAPKVRCGALMVVSCMLEGSSPFLALADEKDKPKMAFTTLSATVTSTVRELHRTLILALVAETSTLVLTQIIKSITQLVQNVPISKLSEGFLTKIARQLKPFLSHKDSNVKVAALTAFGAILSVHPPSVEVSDILLWKNASQSTSTENTSNQLYENAKLNDGSSSWLIEICLANILENETLQPLPVRLESLQVLAIVVKQHFAISSFYITFLKSVVENGLANKDVSLRLHCARLLEELGRAMSQVLESEDSKIQLQIEEVVSFWSSMLKTFLPGILQVQSDEINFQALSVHGCNCVSTIGGEAFGLLSRQQQLFCQSVLIGLSGNENKLIKASAIRGLGVLVLFPCLREDGSFLLDVLENIVEAMKDINLEVRLKAAWALGNLTDALIINEKSVNDREEDYKLDDSSLKQLIEAAINGSKDIDRVSSNGVRALGNLMRFLDQKHLEDKDFTEIVSQSVETLMFCASTSSNMKVRWNACYAIGNMLKNCQLRLGQMSWKNELFNLLINLAKTCKNLKVRISAISALGTCKHRDDYGKSSDFITLWNSLIQGPTNLQSSMNFVEYQHFDHLVDQTCATLCHLLALIGAEDLGVLYEHLTEENMDILVRYFERYSSRLGTHKTLSDVKQSLQTAENNLSSLKPFCLNTRNTLQCIDLLYRLIKFDFE